MPNPDVYRGPRAVKTHDDKPVKNRRPSARKPQDHKTKQTYFKLIVILVVCLFFLGFMCFRIINLQREHGEEYARITISQLMNRGAGSDNPIMPNRGAIVDRNKQVLALSTVVYTVFADIRLLDQRKHEVVETTFEKVSEIMGIPMETLWALLDKNEEGKLIKDTNYYILARQAPQSIASQLNSSGLYDIYTEEDTKRSYVNGGLASHVIGFVRGDAAWGLEGRYDKDLSGVYGREFRTYDSNGRSVVTERVEAEEGNTIVTTLDLYIQQAAERVAVKYGLEYGAQYTSAIVMNPNTGEVLAMASYPSFDLNEPVNPAYITNPAIAESFSEMEQRVMVEQFNTIWRNFNITYTYEPGSIFKPITVAAALEEGIISYDDTFYCPGHKTVLGTIIHCNKRSGHGHITLREALAYSCNVALMDIAERLGREAFYKYQRDFGYGYRTGIDLPGEASAETLLHTVSGLNDLELATASFGQRFNCTPIQAVTAFCALINGGNLYKPYVVSQLVNASNSVVYEHKPEIVRRVISQETSDFLRDALVGTFEYGTGARARIPGYSIGGKSGTAQQGIAGSADYHEAATFVGYFPAEDPQYVVMALIYRPTGDTPSASYMFTELVLDIINYKRIPPTSAYGAASSSGKAMADYHGMKVSDAILAINDLGIDFELVGSGGSVVEGQYPNPGETITDTSVIFLMIARDGDELLVEVPDTTDMTVQEAKAALTAAGFVPVVSYDSKDNTYEDLNKVYEQLPAAFLRIEPGAEVKIKAR